MRTIGVWLALLVVVIAVSTWLGGAVVRRSGPEELREDIALDHVFALTLDGEDYRVETLDGDEYKVAFYELTEEDVESISGENVVYATDDFGLGWLGILGIAVVGIVVIVLGLRFLRAAQARTGQQFMEMAKSRARLVETPPDTRFTDVGGCEEAKSRLKDVVDFLTHPEVWQASGARVPRGVLLEGPPGTGKTHLARAVAGEAGVTFYEASGSEFLEMLIGVGAARVRDLFEKAAKSAPTVIFIDELDAIGRRRGSGAVNFNEERELSLNQLLTNMDGFRSTDRVVVIGATNRVDILDPALVRPGRFDVLLTLADLDVAGRLEVLGIHAKGKPLAEGVDLPAWAERSAGCTGAMLAQLLNESALEAVRHRHARGAIAITEEDLKRAWGVVQGRPGGMTGLDRVLVGSVWQLSRPEAPIPIRATLAGGGHLEGLLLWADGGFLKVRRADGREVALTKAQIVTIERAGVDE